MDGLLQQLQKTGVGYGVTESESQIGYIELPGLRREIDKIVFSQVHLRASFPHVYCVACNAWAEELGQAGWRWVRCCNCKETTHLKAYVVSIVGQIGSGMSSHILRHKLRLDIWDNVDKKSKNIAIDELEIVGGNLTNYNWAVSKVVEMIATHHPQRMGKIKVTLLDSPELEENSLVMLRELGVVE